VYPFGRLSVLAWSFIIVLYPTGSSLLVFGTYSNDVSFHASCVASDNSNRQTNKSSVDCIMVNIKVVYRAMS